MCGTTKPRTAESGNPLSLNMPEFTNRMLAAHKAKSTAAQTYKAGQPYVGCLNTYDDGSHCIIGSGLPEGFITHNDGATSYGINQLVNHKYVTLPEKYLPRLRAIQKAHDDAMTNSKENREKNLKFLRDRLRKFAITIRRDYPEAYATA